MILLMNVDYHSGRKAKPLSSPQSSAWAASSWYLHNRKSTVPGSLVCDPAVRCFYTIAATGERPIQFNAENLPDGVVLDPVKGHLSGSVSEKGTYKITLKATNSKGFCERELRLVVGDRSIDEVINKRAEIANEAKELLQKELDEAETGITVQWRTCRHSDNLSETYYLDTF
jgi:hypothetical protein